MKNKKTAAELMATLREKRENAAYLKDLFESLFGFLPDDRQFFIWLNRFDVEIVGAAIERTCEWLSQTQQDVDEKLASGKLTQQNAEKLTKNETDVLRYASGTMYKMKAKEDGEATPSTSTSFTIESESLA